MTLLFSRFCDLLHDLECFVAYNPPLSSAIVKQRSRDRVIQWLSSHNVSIANNGNNLVALLSALFPKRRTDRVYGIQPAKLTKKLKRILGLGSGRHQLLDRWQQPGRGDLGDCVERALLSAEAPLQPPGRQVTLEEVDVALARIAAGYRFSAPKVRAAETRVRSEAEIDTILRSLYSRIQSREAKWLTRLILKEYGPLQIVESAVFRCIDPRLPIAVKVHDNFEDAIELLQLSPQSYSSVERQPRVGVKVGRPRFDKARSIKNAMALINHRKMSIERKYDGEYCQIHVDRSKAGQEIQIFSKSGKDSTLDRIGLVETLRQSLRLDSEHCTITRNCILEGEMVVWSDREQKILEFHKIRKMVSRSGSFLGTNADSLPHPDEHLMIVLFDVLMADDASLLALPGASRRQFLERVVLQRSGRAELAVRQELDFSSPSAPEKLRKYYARAIASRWEGLVLKPSAEPYFGPLTRSTGHPASSWIKLKKDYIAGLGDTADFVVVGAGYDAITASKCGVKNLSWTHFHIACLENRDAVVHLGAKPLFVVLDAVHQSLRPHDLRYLNQHGQFHALDVNSEGCRERFDLEYSPWEGPKMNVVFRNPFIFEVMGGGFVKLANSENYVLRWPRILKIHQDRQWKDCVTLETLQRMALEAVTVPREEDFKQETAHWQERLEKADRGVRNAILPWDDSQEGGSTSAEPSSTPSRRTQFSDMPSPPIVRMDTSEMLPNEERMANGEVMLRANHPDSASTKTGESTLTTPATSSADVNRHSPISRSDPYNLDNAHRRAVKRPLEGLEDSRTQKKTRTSKGNADVEPSQQASSSANRSNRPPRPQVTRFISEQPSFSLVRKKPPGVDGLPIKSIIRKRRRLESDSPDRQTTASERTSKTTSVGSQPSPRAAILDPSQIQPKILKDSSNAPEPSSPPKNRQTFEEVQVPDLLSSPVMLSPCISRSSYLVEELLPARVSDIIPLPHLQVQKPLPTPPPTDCTTCPPAILLVESNNSTETVKLMFSIIPFLKDLPYAGIQVWDWTLLKAMAKGETRHDNLKSRFFASMWYDSTAQEVKLRWQDGMLKRLKVTANGEVQLVGKAWVDSEGWLHEMTKLDYVH